jgi:phasin family protein
VQHGLPAPHRQDQKPLSETQKIMAKTQTNFFDVEFPKLPDFAQLQADYGRLFGDFGKLFGNAKLPTFDVEGAMAAQRKNVEALTQANQAAIEGVQALAKRQAEIVREAVETYTKLAKEVAQLSAEERFAKQAEAAKEIFEEAIANIGELKEIVEKSQAQVTSVISKRLSDNFDEVKAAFQPKTASAKK